MQRILIYISGILIIFTSISCAQKKNNDLGRYLQYNTVESKALKGNLIGDPYIRQMTILLPPSYFRW